MQEDIPESGHNGSNADCFDDEDDRRIDGTDITGHGNEDQEIQLEIYVLICVALWKEVCGKQ